MNTKQIQYSFIIPHHNIPTLLQRCLASIPRREDVEVIVVDDCSEDVYADELAEVMRCNPSVLFISMDRCRGGGAARNVGLRKAVGKYVLFADADDYFEECIGEVLSDYCGTNYDMVFFKGRSEDAFSGEQANRADHLNGFVDDFLEGQDSEGLQLRYMFGEPWARLVKLSLVREHRIEFDETFIHNDTTFAYMVGFCGKCIHVDDRQLYCVTVRKGSVSGALGLDKTLTRMEVFGRAELFFRKHGIGVRPWRHYEELVSLMIHGRFFFLGESYGLLRRMGLSLRDIFCGMSSALVKMVRFKYNGAK